jgi:serine protease Do
MQSNMRISLGFLLVGLLGVLVGAVIVACVPGKLLNSSASQTYGAASAAPLRGIAGDPDLEQRIISAVHNSEPSVVLIKSTVHGVQQFPGMSDPFFRQFFGNQAPEGQPYTEEGSGSGFILQRSGDTAYVATNAHVVYKADKIEVLLASGRKVDAQVVGADIHDDLAVLKIHGSDLPPALPIGDSKSLQQGQFVLAIGEPIELQNSVSFGIVASVHRSDITASGEGIPPIHYADMIQITTPINPGNSGGPLITDTGDVVGINAVVDAGAQSIGFAIPMASAQPLLAEIQSGKYVAETHPFIGVQLGDMTDQIRNYLGYNGKGGAVIGGVVPGSPADQAGLQQGDVIVQINHQPVTKSQDVTNAVKAMKVGQKVSLLVWRQGSLQPLDVPLADEDNFDLQQQG